MTMRCVAHSLAIALAVAMVPASVTAGDETDYRAGVNARLNGHPDKARALLKRWLAGHPDDVDAQLQLAYANLADGRLDAAETGFVGVLDTAPDYEDARTGLKQVSEARAARAKDGNARLVFEGALSDLSGGAAGWSEAAVDLEIPIERITIGGRATRYHRFGSTDVELGLRLGIHPSSDVWVRAHAGMTPNADFRPEVDVGGGIDTLLPGSKTTVLTLDAAYQRFPLQDVVTLDPGLVQYLRSGRTWFTLRGIGTIAGGGPLEFGGLVRIDHTPAERWRIFAGAANGPDTDLGVITRTSAMFGGLQAPLGDRISATGSLSQEWRNVGNNRTEFRLTLATRL